MITRLFKFALPFLTMASFGIFSSFLPLQFSALVASLIGGWSFLMGLNMKISARTMEVQLGQTLSLFILALGAGIFGPLAVIPYTGAFIAGGMILGSFFSAGLNVLVKIVANLLFLGSIIVQILLFPKPEYLSIGIPLLVVGSFFVIGSRILLSRNKTANNTTVPS